MLQWFTELVGIQISYASKVEASFKNNSVPFSSFKQIISLKIVLCVIFNISTTKFMEISHKKWNIRS